MVKYINLVNEQCGERAYQSCRTLFKHIGHFTEYLTKDSLLLLTLFVLIPCFVMQYSVPFSVLQAPRCGSEIWLFNLNGGLVVVRPALLFCVSSSWCSGLVYVICGISWSFSLAFQISPNKSHYNPWNNAEKCNTQYTKAAQYKIEQVSSLDKKHKHDLIILVSSGINQTTQISVFALCPKMVI